MGLARVDSPARSRELASLVLASSLLASGGCKMMNPAWGDTTDGPATDASAGSTGDTADTTGGPGSSTSAPATTASETTAVDPSETTTPVATVTTADGTSSTGPEPTTSGTTGDALCQGESEIAVVAADADTFFLNAPPFGPAWCDNVCQTYNFGATSTIEIVNLEEHRRLFAANFPPLPPPFHQYSPDWITEIRVKVWYFIQGGGELQFPISLRLYRVAAADAWKEGDKFSEPAGPGDSSFLCRAIEQNDICVGWGEGPNDTPLTHATQIADVNLELGAITESELIEFVVQGDAIGDVLDWFTEPLTHRSVLIEQVGSLQPEHLLMRSREFMQGAFVTKMYVTYTCPDNG